MKQIIYSIFNGMDGNK